MKKIIIVLILICGTFVNLVSQESVEFQDSLKTHAYLKRNSLQINGGFLGRWYTSNYIYERSVLERENMVLNAKVNFGVIMNEHWNPYRIYGLSAGYISDPMENNHLDCSLGFLIKQDVVENTYGLWPNVYVGYRYQKPGKYFLFKSGFGFPTGLSVGFGFAF